MDTKEIIKKTLTIVVFISSLTLISCSDKLYSGNTRQDYGDHIKNKTIDSTEDLSVPSPYTKRYKAKMIDKHF